jgi:8-amino-3,8-dideoxy-alpha-D-manno-octulosonate transaminase
MIITDDEELWRTMSEYQDHGHDHKVNPGTRGGEGRRFIGFNYRMMELQGAIGIAQLAKLDFIVSSQQKNKATLKDAAAKIPNVEFRTLMDEKGDSASFFAFILSDNDHCRRVNESLKADGCGAINFAENSWHFYPKWEHLLEAKSPVASGYPFTGKGGKKRIIYDPKALPQSSAILERTLIYPVSIKMGEDRLSTLTTALAKAATV